MMSYRPLRARAGAHAQADERDHDLGTRVEAAAHEFGPAAFAELFGANRPRQVDNPGARRGSAVHAADLVKHGLVTAGSRCQ